jgi:hypothetical protein
VGLWSDVLSGVQWQLSRKKCVGGLFSSPLPLPLPRQRSGPNALPTQPLHTPGTLVSLACAQKVSPMLRERVVEGGGERSHASLQIPLQIRVGWIRFIRRDSWGRRTLHVVFLCAIGNARRWVWMGSASGACGGVAVSPTTRT